jgi:hypothetical protein
MKTLQDYLRDFQVSDQSEKSLPKVTIKLQLQSNPSPVNPPSTENQGAKLQMPRYRTIPEASTAPTAVPGQANFGSQTGSRTATGSQNLPSQKPPVTGASSSPLHAVQGSLNTCINRVQMPNGEHVLLGVNRGHHLQLVQIDRRECPEDGQFFTKLKEEYKAKRGIFRRWFDVKQFHHCEFVEVGTQSSMLSNVDKTDKVPSLRSLATEELFAAARGIPTTPLITSTFTATGQQQSSRSGKIVPSYPMNSTIGITAARIA